MKINEDWDCQAIGYMINTIKMAHMNCKSYTIASWEKKTEV